MTAECHADDNLHRCAELTAACLVRLRIVGVMRKQQDVAFRQGS